MVHPFRAARLDASGHGSIDLSHVGYETQPVPRQRRKTSCRQDPSWPVHLKQVTAAAISQLSVKVTSARLVEVFEATDRDCALFELESDQGVIHAVLSRSGEYSFLWKS